MNLLILGVKHIDIVWRVVMVEKDISALQVSVKDVHHMQLLETSYHWDEDLPHDGFLQISLRLLTLAYFLIEVAVVGVLHDDAQVFVLISKSFFVGNDVGVFNRC
jgi:hypothetical protein